MLSPTKFWEKAQEILGKSPNFFPANSIFLGSCIKFFDRLENTSLKQSKKRLKCFWGKAQKIFGKIPEIIGDKAMEAAIRAIYIRVVPAAQPESGNAENRDGKESRRKKSIAMKKIQSFLLLLIALVIFQTVGKPQCYGVTVEAFPADPQSGPYNYFGVRVTLAHLYSENITVSGYILMKEILIQIIHLN